MSTKSTHTLPYLHIPPNSPTPPHPSRTQKPIEQCSFHICHSRMQENIRRIESYHTRNGLTGHTTTCYCNSGTTPSPSSPASSSESGGGGAGRGGVSPSPHSTYCLANVVSRVRLIHALLWPSLCLLLGMIVIAVYVMDVTLCCGRVTASWAWFPRRLPTSRPFNSLDRPWVKRTRPLLYEPVTR